MVYAGFTSEFITLSTGLLDLKVNYHYKQPGSKTIKKKEKKNFSVIMPATLHKGNLGMRLWLYFFQV